MHRSGNKDHKKNQPHFNKDNYFKSNLNKKTQEGKICRKIAILKMTAEGRAKLKKSEAIFAKSKLNPDKLSELAKDKDFEVFQTYHLYQESINKASTNLK